MSKNSKFSQKIPSGWNSLCYIHEGKGVFGSNQEEAEQFFAVLIKNDDSEILEVYTKDSECNFILIAGRPIGEAIFRKGPFVLGSQEQLDQAFEDRKEAKNGFENANVWKSSTRERAQKLIEERNI